ncbi:MAG: S24 family peptidase [Sphingobacteriaceae bacterium]|nr:S24 family peptidase [Sphingobacteriaceae bacterium]
MGTDKACKILHQFPEINPEWLLTGEGSMLREAKDKGATIVGNDNNSNIGNNNKIISKTSPKKEDTVTQRIPLVNELAIGGIGGSMFSIAEQDIKDYYVVPKFKHRKIDFMIEVSGSSMYPKYNSGDVVACAIIKESNFIQWNKTHVISTKEQGILIKRIKKGTTDDLVKVISDNKDYDPFEIPISEITGIAIVVGVIRLE